VSLNWKEIDLILRELDLPGAQIQGVAQSAFDVIALRVRTRPKGGASGATRQVLIALSPGACRIHETFRAFPKSDKPLRFAQFLKSRVANGWIEEAAQLGDNRIVRLLVRRGETRFRLYIRLWSNAANFIVTDESGAVLDAMRRIPKKGEVTGGRYAPEEAALAAAPGGSGAARTREYEVRDLPGAFAGGESAAASGSADANDSVNASEGSAAEAGPEQIANSFNAKVDAFYAAHGSALSLEALREQARRECEGSMGRLQAALERLREKERDFAGADRLRAHGDIILANLARIALGDEWLEADNFFEAGAGGCATGGAAGSAIGENAAGAETASAAGAGAEPGSAGKIWIRLDPRKAPSAQAEVYYAQYGKAKKGLADIRREIEAGEREIFEIEKKLALLVAEDNPLVLAKLLKIGAKGQGAKGQGAKSGAKALGLSAAKGKKRPGLSFQSGDWLLIVGRDAEENDALLRRHVKGGDLWLHARDFPGSYVFIKQRAGKTFPLDILLDAGNLALFYSKGRNAAEGDLFYTHVKYLRRAKNGPKGLVIPTQEKNLRVKLDKERLRRLESCRVEK